MMLLESQENQNNTAVLGRLCIFPIFRKTAA